MKRQLVFLLALFGCAPHVECPVMDASPSDASSADAAQGSDVGSDAGCNPAAPLTLSIDGLYAAESPSSSVSCVEVGRVRVYAHGTTNVLVDSDTFSHGVACPPGSFDMNIGPGDYDVTIESVDHPQWLMGGSLVRPAHCPAGARHDAFCAPLRVLIWPCENRQMMAVLHCDPAAGACPEADWPWLGPAP